jgi:hypothetical protein
MTNIKSMLLGPARPKIKLVGVSNYVDAVRRLTPGAKVSIEPEPTNPYDPNAVVVKFEGDTVGYLPAKFAERVVEGMPGLAFTGHIDDVTVHDGHVVGGWVIFDSESTEASVAAPVDHAVF